MLTLLEDAPVTAPVLNDFIDRTAKLMTVLRELEALRRRRNHIIDALEAQALELRRDVMSLASRHSSLYTILEQAGIVGP